MEQLKNFFLNKSTWLENWVVLLTGLWIFLIPFGKGSKFPAGFLAAIGLFLLVRTKGRCACTAAAKAFLILMALYLIPILCSIPDAPEFKYPVRVLMIGIGSALSGLALIAAADKPKTLKRIGLILAAVVGFWLVDAAIQVVLGRDVFGLTLEGTDGRVSGPFRNKNLMGYYAGPFSALLLVYALQKNWKPILLWALFGFTSIIVLLNNSRGGWVMYIVVASVFIWQTLIAPRQHKILICIGVVALGLSILTGLYFASNSFQGRIDQTCVALTGDKYALNEALTDRLPIWEAAWGAFKDHPINGSGARNFRIIAPDYWPDDYGDEIKIGNTFYAHQIVLEYAVGTGLIGLAGLLAFMWLCLRWWHRAAPQQKHQSFAYGLTLLAIYFPFNTHRAMYGSLTAISVWILIALYAAALFKTEESANEG